jgi:hypothetical protein
LLVELEKKGSDVPSFICEHIKEGCSIFLGNKQRLLLKRVALRDRISAVLSSHREAAGGSENQFRSAPYLKINWLNLDRA